MMSSLLNTLVPLGLQVAAVQMLAEFLHLESAWADVKVVGGEWWWEY